MSRPLDLTDALADHHQVSRVSAKCEACGHAASLDTWSLGVKVGWDTPLRKVEAKLRCTRCGAKACRIAVGVRGSKRG